MDKIDEIERELTSYAIEKFQEMPYVKLYGPKDLSHRGGIISFDIEEFILMMLLQFLILMVLQ